jgi:hypothetical protein
MLTFRNPDLPYGGGRHWEAPQPLSVAWVVRFAPWCHCVLAGMVRDGTGSRLASLGRLVHLCLVVVPSLADVQRKYRAWCAGRCFTFAHITAPAEFAQLLLVLSSRSLLASFLFSVCALLGLA